MTQQLQLLPLLFCCWLSVHLAQHILEAL